MRSFRSEPFLWIHLAGIAVLPLCLELMWLGLAIGEPLPFSWLELAIVATVGTAPVLWMQLVCPFDIFSILVVSLQPEHLTHQQRQILAWLKTDRQKILSLFVAGMMMLIVWQLDRLAPLAIGSASIFPQWRIIGLLLAMISALAGNLFMQIPVSVLGIMFSSQERLAAIQPASAETIERTFVIPGWRVRKLFPFLNEEANTKELT